MCRSVVSQSEGKPLGACEHWRTLGWEISPVHMRRACLRTRGSFSGNFVLPEDRNPQIDDSPQNWPQATAGACQSSYPLQLCVVVIQDVERKGLCGRKRVGGPLRNQPRRKWSRTLRGGRTSVGVVRTHVCGRKRGSSAVEEGRSKKAARAQVSYGSRRLIVPVCLCGNHVLLGPSGKREAF